jgi:anthranilate phosphoribosyltransferase
MDINIDIEPRVAERCLNELGICFMFAPRFHSLSPTLAMARRAIGRPTIFNNLGPLCNPASAPHQIIGVWDKALLEKTANVLARLGTKRSWIVHGENGLDEIALSGKTHVVEVSGDQITQFDITADDFRVNSIGGDLPSRCSATESAALIGQIFANERIGHDSEKLVFINAAAAIFIAGNAIDLADAYNIAKLSNRSGAARQKLTDLATETTR